MRATFMLLVITMLAISSNLFADTSFSIISGASLHPSDAQRLLAKFENGTASQDEKLELLGFLQGRREKEFDKYAKDFEKLLIQFSQESPDIPLELGQWGPLNYSGLSEHSRKSISAVYENTFNQKSDSPARIFNLAMIVDSIDNMRKIELLKQGMQLEPKNPRWSRLLALSYQNLANAEIKGKRHEYFAESAGYWKVNSELQMAPELRFSSLLCAGRLYSRLNDLQNSNATLENLAILSKSINFKDEENIELQKQYLQIRGLISLVNNRKEEAIDCLKKSIKENIEPSSFKPADDAELAAVLYSSGETASVKQYVISLTESSKISVRDLGNKWLTSLNNNAIPEEWKLILLDRER